MPDAYGNPTEAERRMLTAYAGPSQRVAASPTPGLIFNGTIGGRTVQLYGEGPALTQEQALAYVAESSGSEARNGALPVSQWLALHPNASAAETDAYKRLNSAYTAQTAGQGMLDKVKGAVNFELDRAGNIVEAVRDDPTRLFTGITPASTRISNTIFGTDKKPLVGQLGGATEGDFQKYEAENGFGSLGAARSGTATADYLAGMFGAVGAANGIGNAFSSLGNGSNVPMQTYQGGANLNYASNAASGAGSAAGEALPTVVVEGTRNAGLTLAQRAAIGAGVIGAGAGLASSTGGSATGATGTGNGWSNTSDPVGAFNNAAPGGNAGNLANSGGISGGAGTGGTTEGALGSLSGAANQISGVGGNMAGTGNWTDWIGPVISAGSALYGGKKANDATERAAAIATAEQRRQFDLVRSDTAGQRALGDAAIGKLSALNTGDMSGFYASPDYNFNLAEGQKAIDRSAVARGGLLSGGAVKEGQRYASGLASREYSGFVDRLMQQAGIGSTGIAASASAGANAANNIGAYNVNAGNARSSTYQNTAASVNNSIQSGLENQMLRRYLGG